MNPLLKIFAETTGLHARTEAGTIRYAVWPAKADRNWCGKFEERPMTTQEVLARVAMIQKMEADRKSRLKPA